MIFIEDVYYRIVQVLPVVPGSNGHHACWNMEGKIVREDVRMWAVIEAVHFLDRSGGVDAAVVVPIGIDQASSKIVAMEVGAGDICCVEEASNFLGYCAADASRTGFEENVLELPVGTDAIMQQLADAARALSEKYSSLQNEKGWPRLRMALEAYDARFKKRKVGV